MMVYVCSSMLKWYVAFHVSAVRLWVKWRVPFINSRKDDCTDQLEVHRPATWEWPWGTWMGVLYSALWKGHPLCPFHIFPLVPNNSFVFFYIGRIPCTNLSCITAVFFPEEKTTCLDEVNAAHAVFLQTALATEWGAPVEHPKLQALLGFDTHTHLLRTVVANYVVEYIRRAKHQQQLYNTMKWPIYIYINIYIYI